MSTAITTFTIDEVLAAHAVVQAVDPSETDPQAGVVLETSAGARCWTVWNSDAIASTRLQHAGESVEQLVLVSPRLVECAVELINDGDDLTLTIDEHSSTISNGTLSIAFSHPEPRGMMAAVEPFDGPAAHASVPARALSHLFSTGRVLPAGVDPDQADCPDFYVAITDAGVYACADWTTAGVPAVTLQIDASTSGGAAVALNPTAAADLVGFTRPDEVVTVSFPEDADWIEIQCAAWTGRLRAVSIGTGAGAAVDRVEEFPPIDTISVEGGLRPDPLPDASLADIRAFVLDPDVQTRMRAAASRWNWDLDVQRALATDPDERIVLALLDHVDPYGDTCQAIIGGPHVTARRELARRNLVTELLDQLARDPDPMTVGLARDTLASRTGRTRAEVPR